MWESLIFVEGFEICERVCKERVDYEGVCGPRKRVCVRVLRGLSAGDEEVRLSIRGVLAGLIYPSIELFQCRLF